LTHMKVKIDPYAVAIVPVTVITDMLLTKEYKVPPGFLTNAPAGDQPTASATLPSGNSGGTIGRRLQAKEFFESHGVQFPPGASATFVASNSRLLVRNTQDQLDVIDGIVEASIVAVPSQVEIEAKFVEISQNNLKELSFDWLLGQFSVGSGDKFMAGGGTSGTGNTIDNVNFPIVDSNGNVVGVNPVTAGNRTGAGLGGAISANAIDALLFPSAGLSSAAPGIFGMAGVLTDPQFQVVVRALNQKKGVDLLSSPRITTKSGQRAKIEIIREFRYPTEFSPPQIPQTVGSTGGTGEGSTGSVPVTPTTPTAFETRNTGVTLDVEPVVGPDGSTIDLNLQPEVVEFEGFINYGSPIMSPATTSRGPDIPVINDLGFVVDIIRGDLTTIPPTVITPNVINQPIFSTRRVTTSVSVWDGQTVALGGLMREDVQKIEDKVPILGDIPFAGRLFRSSVDQHIKRNLVIFVTARLINPAGEPLNAETEEEEVIEPMVPEQLPDAPIPLFTK
jgi:general secretion pathway protein D